MVSLTRGRCGHENPCPGNDLKTPVKSTPLVQRLSADKEQPRWTTSIVDPQGTGEATGCPIRTPWKIGSRDWSETSVTGGSSTLHPVIEEFRELIDSDPIVRMYLTQMIEQVPHAKRYTRRHLENVDQMLRLINEVIGRAPEYNETGLVGVPLNAVLDWCMGTPAGFAAFRHEPINAMFRRILKAWCEFLSSPASLYVLNDSPRGWKCAAARKSTRIEEFQYKPREKYWGFAPGTITSPDDSSPVHGRSRTPKTTRSSSMPVNRRPMLSRRT